MVTPSTSTLPPQSESGPIGDSGSRSRDNSAALPSTSFTKTLSQARGGRTAGQPIATRKVRAEEQSASREAPSAEKTSADIGQTSEATRKSHHESQHHGDHDPKPDPDPAPVAAPVPPAIPEQTLAIAAPVVVPNVSPSLAAPGNLPALPTQSVPSGSIGAITMVSQPGVISPSGKVAQEIIANGSPASRTNPALGTAESPVPSGPDMAQSTVPLNTIGGFMDSHVGVKPPTSGVNLANQPLNAVTPATFTAQSPVSDNPVQAATRPALPEKAGAPENGKIPSATQTTTAGASQGDVSIPQSTLRQVSVTETTVPSQQTQATATPAVQPAVTAQRLGGIERMLTISVAPGKAEIVSIPGAPVLPSALPQPVASGRVMDTAPFGLPVLGNGGPLAPFVFPLTQGPAPEDPANPLAMATTADSLTPVFKGGDQQETRSEAVTPRLSLYESGSGLLAVHRTTSGPSAETNADTEDGQENSARRRPETQRLTESTASPASSLASTPESRASFASVSAAAAPVSGTPMSTQLDRVRLVEQVTKQMESMRVSTGNGEMTLRLRPDHLGSLHISITAHAGGVVARIVAEHGHVQQALEGAKEQLRTALENKGLRLSSLEVSVGQGTVSDGRAAFAGSGETLQERTTRSFLRNLPRVNSAPDGMDLSAASAVASRRPDTSALLDRCA